MRTRTCIALLVLAAILFVSPAGAATVCVITDQSGLGSNILTQVPCGDSTTAPITTLNTTDPKWVAFQANPSAGGAISAGAVNQRLMAGIAVTFSVTPSLSATYQADVGTLARLSAQLGRFAFTGTFPGKASTLVVRDAAKPPVAHTMTAAQVQFLYGVLQDYSSAVNDAMTTAVAGGTLPVWPTATAVGAQ